MLMPATRKSTQDLIAAVGNLSFGRLPPQMVERTKDLILYHLGVSLYGATFEWCSNLRATIEEEGRAARGPFTAEARHRHAARPWPTAPRVARLNSMGAGKI
jgi:hypothetical protein